MYLARPSSRAGPKAPVLAVGQFSSQAGGRLEGWRGFVTPSTPGVTRGGERPNPVRACWLCNKENHIAAACPEVPKELQDKLARQGIQFAKAVLWADRQAKGASPGRRNPKTVHNLRVAILQSIQENLYRESPEDSVSHPEEETTTTSTSGSENDVGEVRPSAPSRLLKAPVILYRSQLHSSAGAVVGYEPR